MNAVRILLISGSTRGASTNTALLRAAQAVAPAGVTAILFARMTELPHFNPDADKDPLHPIVADLRREIAASHAVLFSTPEYAGALPGSFKNLLDWTVGGVEMYRKPVAWANASSSPTAAAHAHASLRTVLGYLNTDVVESACKHIPVARSLVSDEGMIVDSGIREQIAGVLTALARYVRDRA